MSDATHDVKNATPIEATLTFGAREAERRVTGTLRGLQLEGCVITGTGTISDVKYAWLEVELPTGDTIRPLAEVGHAAEEGLPLSFRYLFPKDRERLDKFGAYRLQPA